jgi:hypothetical protein
MLCSALREKAVGVDGLRMLVETLCRSLRSDEDMAALLLDDDDDDDVLELLLLCEFEWLDEDELLLLLLLLLTYGSLPGADPIDTGDVLDAVLGCTLR